MTRVRIKICGISNPADAAAAVAAGADALGLVFHQPSPRYVTPWQARQVVASLPPYVTSVGLFVDHPAAAVRTIIDQTGIDLLQFHGSETPEFCRSFDRPWYKVLRVREALDLGEQSVIWGGARGLMVDAWQAGVAGGTGSTFDWSLVTGRGRVPLILAGGLNATNVATAIRALNPWAVDVSSGVEAAPGRKDATLFAEFCAAVTTAGEVGSP